VSRGGLAIAPAGLFLALAAAGCLTASQQSRLQTDMSDVRQQVFQMQKDTAAILSRMEGIEQALSRSENASPTRFADLEALLQSLSDQVRALGARIDDNTARMTTLTQEIALARQQYRALDARLAAAIATRGLPSQPGTYGTVPPMTGSPDVASGAPPPAGGEHSPEDPDSRRSDSTNGDPSRAHPGVGGLPGTAPASSPSAPMPPAGQAGTPPPAQAAMTGEADVAEQEAAFRAAYSDYTRGSYESALMGFQEFLKSFPGSALTEGAQYYAGDCLFSQQRYEEASDAFTVVIEQYPSSDRAPAAHLKKGLSLLALKQTARGVIQLQHVIETYPRSEEARLARERLRQLGLTVR